MSTEKKTAKKRMTRSEALCLAVTALRVLARSDSDYREQLIEAEKVIDAMSIAQARQAGRNSFAAAMVKGKTKAEARQIRKTLKKNRLAYKAKHAKESAL